MIFEFKKLIQYISAGAIEFTLHFQHFIFYPRLLCIGSREFQTYEIFIQTIQRTINILS